MSKGSSRRPAQVSAAHVRAEYDRIFAKAVAPELSDLFEVRVISTWNDWRYGRLDGTTPEGHAQLYEAGCACIHCKMRRKYG